MQKVAAPYARARRVAAVCRRVRVRSRVRVRGRVSLGLQPSAVARASVPRALGGGAELGVITS